MAKETSINVFKKKVDLLVCIIKPVEQLHHSADNLRLEQNEKNSLLQTHTHTHRNTTTKKLHHQFRSSLAVYLLDVCGHSQQDAEEKKTAAETFAQNKKQKCIICCHSEMQTVTSK